MSSAPVTNSCDTCHSIAGSPQRTNFTEEDAPEKPRKKDDHNIDCLGHILVAWVDDLPEVSGTDVVPSPESRELDEHFERELRRASGGRSRTPVRGVNVPTNEYVKSILA
jgi:hypothetical protein